MSKRIDVKDLNVYYGDFLAVEDVTINIEAKSVTAFIGPSGCGKSTFLRCLNRMNDLIPGARADGEVRLAGQDVNA
ncbi:MAG: ATP-binding cassette domain-containing protein, partial [Actinomycetes bacterium]